MQQQEVLFRKGRPQLGGVIRQKLVFPNFFIGLPISKPLEKLGFVLIASRFATRPNWGPPFLGLETGVRKTFSQFFSSRWFDIQAFQILVKLGKA